MTVSARPSSPMLAGMDPSQALAHAPIPILLREAGGTVRFANRAWRDLTGNDPCGRDWSTLLHPDDQGRDQALDRRLEAAEAEACQLPTRLLLADGSWRPVTLACTAIPGGVMVSVLSLPAVGAAAAGGERRQIAAALSHDIRQHARLGAAYLTLVLRGELPAEARSHLETVLAQLERQQAALAGLVRWLRLADQPVCLTTCDPRRLWSDALAATPGVAGTCSEAPELLRTDPDLLLELLLALLANVRGYGGGEAALALRRDGGDWLLLLDDAGPGIPPDDRLRVLGPLQRLHAWDEVPGQGMGLAIAARIAGRLGGSLAIEESPAGGCRVQVRVPV